MTLLLTCCSSRMCTKTWLGNLLILCRSLMHSCVRRPIWLLMKLWIQFPLKEKLTIFLRNCNGEKMVYNFLYGQGDVCVRFISKLTVLQLITFTMKCLLCQMLVYAARRSPPVRLVFISYCCISIVSFAPYFLCTFISYFNHIVAPHAPFFVCVYPLCPASWFWCYPAKWFEFNLC